MDGNHEMAKGHDGEDEAMAEQRKEKQHSEVVGGMNIDEGVGGVDDEEQEVQCGIGAWHPKHLQV